MPLPSAPKIMGDTVGPRAYGAKTTKAKTKAAVKPAAKAPRKAALFSPEKVIEKGPAAEVSQPAVKTVKAAVKAALRPAARPAAKKPASPAAKKLPARPQTKAAPEAAAPLNIGAARLRKPRTEDTESKPRIFVLDTNVLLHDPTCLFRFQEHDVFLPLTTLEELDNHKTGLSDVSRNARQVSRTIDQLLELQTGSIKEGVKLDGLGNIEARGRLFFQTRSYDDVHLPEALALGKNDNLILTVVKALQKELPKKNVVLVSKDINMRIKATALGLAAEDYFNDKTIDDTDMLYTGRTVINEDRWAKQAAAQSWEADGRTWCQIGGPGLPELSINEFVTFADGSFTGQVKMLENGMATLASIKDYIQPKNAVWGIHARNIEQSFALNLLMDPEIDFVSLLGQAGTGKTLMTLAAALTQTLDERRFSEIIFTRATVSVGEDIGYLPGTEEEKMEPWMGALEDNLEVLNKSDRTSGDWGRSAAADLIRSRVRVKSMSFMRGRTFLNKFVIIDEAQNLSPKQMKTLITRAGPGSKIVCLGNIAQIDTPYLTEGSSGLTYVVDRFKGWTHAGHVTLQRGERSRLADYASEVL